MIGDLPETIIGSEDTIVNQGISGLIPELANSPGIPAPIFPDLHPEVEIHLGVKQPLRFLPGFLAHAF